MNVLLVHGIFDTGAIFRKLERDLTQQGHRCFSPSLHPSDARKGIADLAEKLDVLAVKEFGNEAPIVIVAFSMGCLVARYYVQCLGGARRTKAFFAISGPHNGSLLAHLYPGEGARDMRPGSKFLQELASSEVLFGEMPLFTYWTPLDLTIVPATSSRWSRAIEKIIWVPLHPLMPANGRVRADIVQRIHEQKASHIENNDAGVKNYQL
jgi:triacylglycerol lipase